MTLPFKMVEGGAGHIVAPLSPCKSVLVQKLLMALHINFFIFFHVKNIYYKNPLCTRDSQ